MPMTDNLLLFLFACAAICTVFLGRALLKAWAERRAQKRYKYYLNKSRKEGEPNG